MLKTSGVLWSKDILPSIENVPVQDIKACLLNQVLEPIIARSVLETVRRLVQRINEIMIYAINTGLIDANSASGIGNAFERPKKQHTPTIRPEELPKLMRTISMSNLSIPTHAYLNGSYDADSPFRSLGNRIGRDRYRKP